MKKLFTSIFALALMTTANAQISDGARVYAYGLTQTDGDNITVTFKTNVTAKSAKVILFADGKENIEKVATSEDGKNWTVVIEPSASFAADVEYNWKAEVSADKINTATVVYGRGFNRASALAVDKNPESAFFGNLYVSENKGGTGSTYDKKASTTGLYTSEAALSADLTHHAIDNVIGDESRSSSPRAMTITSDGQLYASACDATKQGLFKINPADFTATQVISGKKIYGIGAKDNDIYYVENNADNTGYNISSTAADFTSFASNIQNLGTYPHNSIVPVEEGIWVHYSDVSGTDETKNHLHFVDYTGNMKWTINSTVKTDRGGMAIDENNKILAYYSKDNGVIYYNYSFDDNGVPSLGEMQSIPTNQVASGSRSEAMTFDYAGNLYILSTGGEWIKVVAMPTEDNTCVTPAKKDLTVSFSQAEIEASGIATIGADVNAPVEYYNLQGVKVANPENGVFIKKQGNKAVKVVL